MVVLERRKLVRQPMLFCAAYLLLLSLLVTSVPAGVYYISPTGSDAAGDGSADRPWQTIRHATDTVPDNGSTILLKDGLYVGTQSLGRTFTETCTIKAENAYRARLESPANSTRAFYCYNGANARFEGLDVFGSGSTDSEYVVHLSNATTHHLTFENCFIHDSYNNDIVKINSQAHDITFRRCVLYNQAPAAGNEHFDINTVTDITLERNLLLNDFAGSGRPSQNVTHPYIVVKNSGDSLPDYTKRINVRQNVFVNWSGAADQSYLLLGEDGKPFYEAQDVMIENNLFAFNSGNPMPGALTLKGGLKNITFRSNTIVGHPAGGGAYAMRMNKEGSNPNFQDIYYYNNIWSDPSGNMVDFSDGSKADVNGDLVLHKNLYWNADKNLPADAWSVFDPDAPGNDDPAGVFADPKLGNPAGMTIPRWNAATGEFISGETTIDGEFQRLVDLYARLPVDSPAIDMADPNHAPATDILGQPRDNAADIGAYEYQKVFIWKGDSGSRYWSDPLNWSNGTVPDAPGVSVVFGTDSAANTAVLDTANRTVGALIFSADTPLTITATVGGNSLTMDHGLGLATLSVSGSGHQIDRLVVMKLNSDAQITIDVAGDSFTIASDIRDGTGSHGIAKDGPGTLVLSGSNTYSGGTKVLAGTLSLTGSIPNTSGVAVDATGGLELSNVSASVLAGTTPVTNNGLLNVTTADQQVGALSGTGSTKVNGSLSAVSIVQNTLTIGDGGSVTIRESSSVANPSMSAPEPSTLALLGMGAIGVLLFGWRRRKRMV